MRASSRRTQSSQSTSPSGMIPATHLPSSSSEIPVATAMTEPGAYPGGTIPSASPSTIPKTGTPRCAPMCPQTAVVSSPTLTIPQIPLEGILRKILCPQWSMKITRPFEGVFSLFLGSCDRMAPLLHHAAAGSIGPAFLSFSSPKMRHRPVHENCLSREAPPDDPGSRGGVLRPTRPRDESVTSQGGYPP